MTYRVCFWAALCVALIGGPAKAQNRETRGAVRDPVEASHLEYALSAEQLEALVGQTFDLLYTNGKTESNVEIKEFLLSKQSPDRFRSIEVMAADGKKPRKLPAQQIFQLSQGETEYVIALLPSQKYYVLIDTARRDQAVNDRLKAADERIWEPIPPADQEKFVAEGKEFIQKVQAHFDKSPMQFTETNYYLILSDMPSAQLAPYIRQLDQMCDTLGQAFGFPPGHNVWRGKAIFIIFMKESDFVVFESVFMQYTVDLVSTQGLCHHTSDGNVVVSACRGNNPEHFGALLVHETAHGYMHRYKSTVFIPSWLNEGIADWIAGIAVPSCKTTVLRQKDAVAKLQREGALGQEYYSADRIEPWQYGVASSMVHLLAQRPELFKLFFNGIKEGLTWQDSLMRSYGMTPRDLTTAYGRAIGVPNLVN